MRTSMFARFDRGAVYHREQPARRLAVILSMIFLLSLATVAVVTTVRANDAQDSARISVADLSAATTH